MAIGAFDGIHKGHQEVIGQMVKKAEKLNVPSVIYTFDPPPRAYFQQAKTLLSYEQKIEKVRKLGVDHVVVAHFNEEYLNRSALFFICELKEMSPYHLIVGEDFKFGYKRTGDVNLLRKYFEVETIAPVCCPNGERISSTRIRQLISDGKIEQAIPRL
jgi:riboflavin kinase/FMN adenylyltransferase